MPNRNLALTVLVLVALVAVAGGIRLSSGPTSSPPEPSAPAPAAPPATEPAVSESVPIGDGGLPTDLDIGCLTGVDHAPTGAIQVIEGTGEPTGPGEPTRYLIEVEEGLGVDADCFAAVTEQVLGDAASWAGSGDHVLQRVDSEPVAFRVSLLGPAAADAECAPLETEGIYSCWSGTRAVINVWRWEHGTAEYGDALDVYRQYVINHEVGHALGHGHVPCPGEGLPAPVMQQQTKGLDGCTINGLPLSDER